MPDPVGRILEAHGLRVPWVPLPATGIANRIYATADVVLRVATDHPDAVSDARTESVAAPLARAAGLPVPELLVFDDSRRLVDRPFSIWERVHGETLGLLEWVPSREEATWREIGSQLAHLHVEVESCPDPQDWLDRPKRMGDLKRMLAHVRFTSLIAQDTAEEIEGWIDELRPHLDATERRFLHNDIHARNVMCDIDGRLLAILDWGDAGWGDPTLELAQVPLTAVPAVLAGYRDIAPQLLGDLPEARIAWDKLGSLLDHWKRDSSPRELAELRRFMKATGQAWRS